MPPEAAQAEVDPDTLVIEVPDDAPENDNADTPTGPTEAERVASLMGWKADFKGAGKKSAEEFLVAFPEVLRNANNKIRSQDDKLARVVGKIAQFEATQKKAISAQHERALAEAVEAGDIDGAKRILAEAKEIEKSTDDGGALASFKARNEWYGSDEEATAYAESLDRMYANKANGKISNQDDHMKKIEEGVKKKFPELFDEEPATKPEPKTPQRAPLVAGGGRIDRPTGGMVTVATMTPQMRQAAKEFGVSEESYVKSWNHNNAKQRANA